MSASCLQDSLVKVLESLLVHICCVCFARDTSLPSQVSTAAGEQQAAVCGNSTEEVRQAAAAEDILPAAPGRQFSESAGDGNGHALLPRYTSSCSPASGRVRLLCQSVQWLLRGRVCFPSAFT